MLRVFRHDYRLRGCRAGATAQGAKVLRRSVAVARVRAVDGDVVLFAHGNIFRVFAARWIGLPPAAGSRFLLNTATLNILGYYREIPAVKRWNAMLIP